MGLVKYALLFPVVGLLILSSNVQAIVQMNGSEMSAIKTDSIVAKGIVVDENDKPLKNVTVLIHGANVGTSTNEKGEFTIRLKLGCDLVFSYVGKKTQMLTINDGKTLLVKMENGVVNAEEVVVVGYDFEKHKTREQETDKDVYEVVEEMPEFVDGTLGKFLGRNVKYPVEAQEKKIQGKVVVQFIIEKTGKITGIKVINSVHPSLDAEAIRVIKSMPDWKPGKQRGEAVRVAYSVPINFRLQ